MLKDLNHLVQTAINAVKPETIFDKRIFFYNDTLTIIDKKYSLNNYKNMYLIGAGKASAAMAFELEQILGERISSGVVSTKYRHSIKCSKIKIIEAGHPVPDENGLMASEKIYELASKAGENDLVICLISGGGSALMEKLPEGISLNNLQTVNNLLLKCTASIEEINIIRKHLSKIKGGQLAQAIYPAECLVLIISDVIGDPLESIASGPTVPDSSTFSDALKILLKYKLNDSIPEQVKSYLENGAVGYEPETIKADSKIFNRVQNIILANNSDSLIAVEEEAKRIGYKPVIVSSALQGEAKEAAKILSEEMKKLPAANKPACLIFGGETTVNVKGNGKGGRNQELILAALIELKNISFDFALACVGTDGTDGSTDAAGGIISNYTLEKIKNLNLNPMKYLEQNDSYTILKEINGLIFTGPTGTNVMDIAIALVE